MRTPIKPVKNPHLIMEHYKQKTAIKYGNYNIKPMLPKSFASYPVLVVLMSVLQVLTVIFGHKMLYFFGFQVSAGWIFLMPIVIYIFQISAECYGWQYARQMIWLNFLVNATLAIIMCLFSLIPMSTFDHYDIEYAYKTLLAYQTAGSITMLIGMFLADCVTSSLICWSKFQFNGQYLAVRILILHCISEIIVLSGGFITGTMVGFSINTIWHFSIDSFLARSLVMLVLLPFIKIIIWFIQHKIERAIVFDLKSTFNIFKFNINSNDFVMFNVGNNDHDNVGHIDMKKLAQAYTNLIIEEKKGK
jgi:uncharacterized PurR-regulated membrane protein YhhQ (DUF165 family)